MANKLFWFNYYDDYRSGPHLSVYTKEPELDPNEFEALSHKFELPSQDLFRIFIVKELELSKWSKLDANNFYKTLWTKDINLNEDYNEIYLKIYSEINQRLPFVVSDWNCAYKEEGHYPDIPDNYKDIPNYLNNDIIEEINDSDVRFSFIFIIDKDGNEILCKLL